MQDQIEATHEKTQEEIIAEAVEAQLAERLEARIKEERDKIARGMLNEGRQRERNEFKKLFEKHGMPLGENPEETIGSLFENMKQLQAKEPDAEMLAQLDAAYSERDTAVKARDEAIASHHAFVIQTELTHALSSKAVDPASAIKYLMVEHSFEMSEEGMRIKDRSGAIVHNDQQEPATVDWVVESFLTRHPYLAKASERQTDTQLDDVTSGGVEFLKKLRGEWTESELQKALEMVSNGTIVNKGGKWVVR